MTGRVEIAPARRGPTWPPCCGLNNGAEPHVPALPEARFRRLLEVARLAVVARRGAALLGFLVAVDPGADHESDNYGWFCARYRALHLRPTASWSRRRRAASASGRRLYAAVEALAPRPPRIVCEVNELPPNPVSLAFHKAIGFVELAKVDSGPGKRVVMLEKPLS